MGHFAFFNHMYIRMIRAKNCEKLSKFVEVTIKILYRSFFPDTVYITHHSRAVNNNSYLLTMSGC